MADLPRMWRPVYILYRVFEMLVSLLSRAINAFIFGGSTHQTTSARSYFEGRNDPVWARRRDWIDWLLAWQMRLIGVDMPHCEWAAGREVLEARKTLERAGI